VEAPLVNTILLLDDNPAVVQILSTILRINGQYHVFEAGNPHEAVIQFEQPGCEIDLVIADVCVGDDFGRTAVEQLMTLHPRLRVLFVSGYTRGYLVGNGMLQPADEFLAKPFTPDTLLHRVAELLRCGPTPM
jgi:two-component system cell cycle sensor histidine kinase/response regulator CckA